MAFREYDDPSELRHVQQASTLILKELDRVCRELDIRYAVYAGTAIGAVRHHGFIPWDDDVDVCMTRRDYERFLSEAPACLAENFEIANSRTNPVDFPCVYSYLTLKDTIFIPEFYRSCSYRKPLSIDIFPLDNIADDPKEFKRQARSTWIWGRLAFVHATPRPYLTLTGWKRALVLAVCFAAHWGMRILRIRSEWIQQRWEKAARRFEHEDCARMTEFTGRDPLRLALTEDELFPAIDVPFEDITVKLPRGYDAILSRAYGTYMELPPKEERKNHRPYLVDFGPY